MYNQHNNNNNNKNQQNQDGKQKQFTQRHDVVVSFSLDDEILRAINRRVGNNKGKRSLWAREVFRKALDI